MKRAFAGSSRKRDGSGQGDPPRTDQVPAEGSALLNAILANRNGSLAPGPTIGRLVGFSKSGECLVDYEANGSRGPVVARTVVPLRDQDRGKEVVLLFECGEFGNPIVMGIVLTSCQPEGDLDAGKDRAQTLRVEVDGESIELSADSQIVLRCGEASITLTKAGKILINGTYLLSRSSGLNRIKGGSI